MKEPMNVTEIQDPSRKLRDAVLRRMFASGCSVSTLCMTDIALSRLLADRNFENSNFDQAVRQLEMEAEVFITDHFGPPSFSTPRDWSEHLSRRAELDERERERDFWLREIPRLVENAERCKRADEFESVAQGILAIASGRFED